jgi:hypothetical protein
LRHWWWRFGCYGEGEANQMRDGSVELKDICDQLDRYGTCTMPDCFLDLLWVMTDINDDIAHGRDPALIRENIAKARVLLDELGDGLC